MTNDISAVTEIVEQNEKNIEAIAKELGVKRKLKDDIGGADWGNFSIFPSNKNANLSDTEKTAKRMQQNAENLLLVAEEAGVKQHRLSGKRSKADFTELLTLD